MAQTVAKLPDDIDALKALVHAKDNHIAILEEKLRLASQKRFGTSSEKSGDDQLGLFNEAEQASCDDASPEATASDETTVVPEHTRKKPGRKPLPDHLPRTRVEHDIAEAAKLCACGCRKTKIGAAACAFQIRLPRLRGNGR
jgi:transposase